MSDIKPWYRQLWPWLILLPPLAAILAGIATWVIASQSADVPISSAVKRRGLVKLEDPEALANARNEGLAAYLSCSTPCAELRLSLSGNLTEDAPLRLALFHHLDPDRDLEMTPEPLARGRYRVSLPGPLAGRFRVRLFTLPVNDGEISQATSQWLLLGRFAAEDGETILSADGS